MWHSYHLYRPRPHERFLVEEVKPFVESLDVDSFFFVRYADPADHIRLRLRSVPSEVEGSSTAPRTNSPRASAEGPFASAPSVVPRLRSALSNRNLDDAVLQRFPDARCVEYVPELERYGGPSLMPVAERQFDASSRFVLQEMSDPQWSYDAALRTAIRMHLSLAEAFGLDVRRFFRRTTLRFLRKPGTERDRDDEARIVAKFDARFEQWRDAVAIDEPWLETMRGLARELAPCDPNILQSFVHMTNNRLGIRHRDEAFVARMIVRARE